MTILEQLAPRSRVAVIRLRSLTDCILSTPGIALLKRSRPDLNIGVAVEPQLSAVFEDNPAVAEVLPPVWQPLRRWGPSLCVNLDGSARSQWMTALSGARYRAGFTHHSTTLAYNVRIGRTQRILGVQRTVHTAEHLASAFFAVGVPVQKVPRAELFAIESLRPDRYAVLDPFASSPDQRWPAERFCEVARYLKLWHVTPVFLSGGDDHAAAFREYEIFSGNLAQRKALLSKAVVFIGRDDGTAQIAAAFGVPSVVFSEADPAIGGPWRTESEVISIRDGLEQVSVSRIVAALERLRVFEEAHA